MHQESAARDHKSSELDGYGDLSSLASATRRPPREFDEQKAIAMIMGDDDFLVGDGTLELPLQEEDRDHLPAMPVEESDVNARHASVERAPAVPSPVSEHRSFAPIEDEMGDDGDEVARIATMEALARLEKLAAAHEPDLDLLSDVPDNEVDYASRQALSDSVTDELLSGEGGFGGVVAGVDSEAPTPFALPKLPGAFKPYIPQVVEGIVQTGERLDESVGDTNAIASSVEDNTEELSAFLAAVEVRRPAVANQQPEEFAPFDISRVEDVQIFNTLDSSIDAIPSYASARESKPYMSAVESEIDELLPPSSEDRQRHTYSEHPAEGSPIQIPAYSSSRQPAPGYESIEHSETNATTENDQRADEADSFQSEPQEEPQADAAPPAAPQSFFQKNRNMMVLGLVIVGLMGGKHYLKQQTQGKQQVTAPFQLEEGEAIDLTGLISTPTSEADASLKAAEQLPLPIAKQPSSVEIPVQGAQTEVFAAPATTGQPDPTAAKLAELADRLTLLEAERNKLLEENEALKAKKVAAATPKPRTPPQKKAEMPKAEIDPAPSPSKPLPAIQYLGTFHEGDRMVAEVLIDGRLARVRRGETVAGGHHVDAVDDMSVTINEVVYSP